MPTPSRNDIYEAVIRKMVTQALEEQETIFEQNHGQDTDAVLNHWIFLRRFKT